MSELPPGEAQLDPPALALIRVAELQAEVVRLRGHKERCEHATLGLLRELLQVRARVQMQASELRQLRQEVQQAAWSPEKEELEVSHWVEQQTRVNHPFPDAWDTSWIPVFSASGSYMPSCICTAGAW